jgi:hypothetical protein
MWRLDLLRMQRVEANNVKTKIARGVGGRRKERNERETIHSCHRRESENPAVGFPAQDGHEAGT